MNRKGDAFLLILDILFLAAIVFIFAKLSVAFTQQNPDEGIGTRQAALLHTYAVSEQMLLYVDEAAQFAAYEALATTMGSGIKLPDSKCPQYATYTLWSSPEGGCMPVLDKALRTSVYGAFERTLQADLCRYLRYPGFPGCISYDLNITPGNGLSIIGMAHDSITLPIVAAKDAAQQEITPILLQENVAKARSDFRADAGVPVTAVDTANRKPRAGTASHIVIQSGHATKEEAIQEYTYGLVSVHYLVDRDGAVYQIVPEDQRAFSLPQCDVKGQPVGVRCEIKDIEDKAITISLVNNGPSGVPDKGGKCAENRVPLTRTGWCDGQCPGVPAEKYAARCWESYTQQQVEALEGLVIDIAVRNGLKPENILLEEQVQRISDRPGPALHKEVVGPVQPGTNLQAAWYKALLGAVVEAKAREIQEEVVEEGAAPAQAVAQAPIAAAGSIILPVNPTVLSSCYGLRNYAGSRNHTGVDFAVPVGTPVLAVTDGVVKQTCEDWVGQCACNFDSTKSACYLSCYAKSCLVTAERQFSSRGYGNNVLIEHDGFSSHYSHLKSVNVKPGEKVKKGQVIGMSGNTGSSGGPHLHFAVFYGKVTSLDKSEADPPLCIYPDELLRTMKVTGASCEKYKTVSRSDPVFAKECEGVQALAAVPDCSVNTMPLASGGNRNVDETMKRLEALKLMPVIKDAAEKNKVDEKLIIAIITQESAGRPDLVSWSGCAGIAQFCLGTAKSGEFAKIFGDGFRQCQCPKGDCTAASAGCVGDPRFDATKSIYAAALHLSQDSRTFAGKTDQALFAVASYNGGAGVIRAAIKKTGKPDPRWPEVSAALEPSMITYMSSQAGKGAKVEEIRDYVSKVGTYYVAVGGSLSSAFSDMECNSFNVKEMGTYTFTPSFRTAVPDLMTYADRAVTWAQGTVTQCDGSGGKDNSACIAARIAEFNRGTSDLEITACESPAKEALLGLRETIADCQENKQDLCTCTWKAPKSTEEITIEFSQTAAGLQADISDAQDDSGKPPLAFVQEAQVAGRVAKLTLGQQPVLEVTDANGENKQRYNINDLVFRRQQGKLVIVTRTLDTPACGEYKTTHRVCMQLKHPIPVLSKGTQLETPDIMFSLWLNDTYVPEPVTGAVFQSFSGLRVFTFTASASEDVSYYRYSCDDGTGARNETLGGRDGGKRINGQMIVEDCAGQPFMQGNQYALTIVPVDLSGNQGPAVTCKTDAAMEAIGIPTATCTGQDTGQSTGQTP